MRLEPELRVRADVDVNTERGTRNADRISAVLQDHRHFRGVRVLIDVHLRQQQRFFTGDDLVVAGIQAFAEEENRVHRARVVDMIGRDPGGVGGSRWLVFQHLPKQSTFLDVVGKRAAFAEVLIADDRSEVLPFRIGGVGGRGERIEGDVAGAAGNSYAIGADELRISRVGWVVVVTGAVPLFFGGLVESGIGEKAEAHDAGGPAIHLGIDG